MGTVWGVSRGRIGDRLLSFFDPIRGSFDPEAPTPRDVVEVVNEQAGEQLITEEYVGRLLSGEERDPSLAVMRAIAKALGVSVAYFTDELTDKQAWLTANAVWLSHCGHETAGQMTTEQMSLELRAGVNSAVEAVINKWTASGAFVQSPHGILPVAPRLVSLNRPQHVTG